jgi:hypothetical protein
MSFITSSLDRLVKMSPEFNRLNGVSCKAILLLLISLCLIIPGSAGTLSDAADAKAEKRKVKTQKESPWKGDKTGFYYRMTPGTEFKHHDKHHIELVSGQILIDAHHTIYVDSPLASVQLKRGALVLFRISNGVERFMVVHDNGHGSAQIVCKKFSVTIGPGEEAMITHHEPSHREILETDDIGRRRVKMHLVGDDHHITTSEYSILQALERDPLLFEISKAQHHHDRVLKSKIIKTAAVLSHLTSHHGFYSSGSRF